MALTQFYGVLATTASIFVGILTAYLVTRLSDLKSQRSRIKQRIESVDAEAQVLKTSYTFRIDRLEETEDRWRRENAEEDVDNFIEYTVGWDWNPPADEVTPEDALEALIVHRDLTSDGLIQHHIDYIEDRWEDIIDELQPRGLTALSNGVSSDALTAANWVIDTLWEVYDREKYDTHDSKTLHIQQKISELKNEREILLEQYEALDPKQLRDSIKAAIVPIALSVVFPIIMRFLHELGWELVVPPIFVTIEPLIVLMAWLVGFFWTLKFVWVRVAATDSELPEFPLSDDEMSGLSNFPGSNEADE